MDDGRALLDRVLESPDADEPRLVYADWLIERGDPRGEFISVQFHLLRKLSPSARVEQTARAAALLGEHGSVWAEPVASIAYEYAFARGFIERVKAADGFVEACAPLFANEPVRELQLHCSGVETVEKLVAAGIIGRLSRLVLRGPLGDAGVEVLVESPQLATLRNLNLCGIGLGPGGAAMLGRCRHLGALTTLALSGNEIGSEGLAAIAGGEFELEALFVARNEITDDGVLALAGSRLMGSLVKIGLEGNEDIGEEAVDALRASGRLRLLEC